MCALRPTSTWSGARRLSGLDFDRSRAGNVARRGAAAGFRAVGESNLSAISFPRRIRRPQVIPVPMLTPSRSSADPAAAPRARRPGRDVLNPGAPSPPPSSRWFLRYVSKRCSRCASGGLGDLLRRSGGITVASHPGGGHRWGPGAGCTRRRHGDLLFLRRLRRCRTFPHECASPARRGRGAGAILPWIVVFGGRRHPRNAFRWFEAGGL